jgi:hypothetical protein
MDRIILLDHAYDDNSLAVLEPSPGIPPPPRVQDTTVVRLQRIGFTVERNNAALAIRRANDTALILPIRKVIYKAWDGCRIAAINVEREGNLTSSSITHTIGRSPGRSGSSMLMELAQIQLAAAEFA